MKLFPTVRQRSDELLRRPFTSLFDDFFGNGWSWNVPALTTRLPQAFAQAMIPAVDIAEEEKTLIVSLEMPGLDEKDIKVEVLGNQLIVSAERKFEQEKKGKDYHRVEQEYGSFQRTLQLPTGLKTDQIEAVYKRGILMLTIPKVEPTPTKKIAVKTAD